MITSVVQGRVLKVDGQFKNIPISIDLIYDEDSDPMAVKMLFNAPGEPVVEWTVGRDLMIRGSVSYAHEGEGDVKFRWAGGYDLLVCLKSPTGHADIQMNQRQVVAFLELTTHYVKAGEESVDDAIDLAIKEIMNS